jgi:hypothetical protein
MNKYIFLLLLLICASCVDEFDLNKNNNGSTQRIVVEGLISDISENSYVRLTYSISGLIGESERVYLSEKATPINNALVIVSDDMGNTDTLGLAPEYTYYTHIEPDTSYVVKSENNCYQKGYYNLKSLKPVPKHTYYLKVLYKGEEYHSECFMPELPRVDSISFLNEQGQKPNNMESSTPRIYFQDNPNESNYYLFNTAGASSAEMWFTSFLSDEFFNGTYVNGLDLGHIQSNIYWRKEDTYWYSMPYYITMYSLTKEAYNYYDALLKEFSNDGGTYKPTPGSPQPNIDNGALGFFRASSTLIFKGMVL